MQFQSKVEEYFFNLQPVTEFPSSEKVKVITVDNYATLGQLTALRFLEWVNENPEGLVALPTGKTPEYFIKWVLFYLNNWDKALNQGILKKAGFANSRPPGLSGLHFVQLDEFFPINPEHERSFSYFVKKYYLEGFGLDPKKAMLIDSWNLKPAWKEILHNIENLEQIFPDGNIVLRLRTRQPANEKEWLQRKTIRLFDQFCENYEEKIRSRGGIGFFLGGIGPDGHVAFNVKGSSHHSHTRLTGINYPTMAQAAQDLGGIESVRKKAVITIGLETITYNKDCVSIITAAGVAKSGVVARALQEEPSLDTPASSLHKLENARFYLTQGAALGLQERNWTLLKKADKVPAQEIEKLVIQGSKETNHLLMEVANETTTTNQESPAWALATDLTGQPIHNLANDTYESLIKKINKGLDVPKNQRILHTAPHHDDIELAYFPMIHHLVRSATNENYFCYCTSGFTSVTNEYVLPQLKNLETLLKSGKIYAKGGRDSLLNPENGQDDIHGYLNGIASQKTETQDFYVSCRLLRLFSQEINSTSDKDLLTFIENQINAIGQLTPGQKDSDIVQRIKGWLREWEADLVWAHFGIEGDKVHHLRLKFYTGEIFPEDPDERDVTTFLNLLEEIKPSVVTLAMDPEGSGPDTHFKTLIAIARALEIYMEKNPGSRVRVWGYRNVWTRFHPSEVNTIIPVSLNSFAVLHNMFDSCFSSQKSASFPSHELDGTFSHLAQKIWTEQLNDLVSVLGNDFLYNSTNPLLRRAYGAIYLRDMSYQEFQTEMTSMKNLLKAKEKLILH